MEIYTIGHSNHTVENLSALLRKHAIEVLVDVRSQPYSRHVPHFNRETLAHTLREQGFSYEHRGDRLGGRPTDEGFLLADGSVDYDRLRASQDFQQALDELLALAQERRVALMCAEIPKDKRPRLMTWALLLSRLLSCLADSRSRTDDLNLHRVLQLTWYDCQFIYLPACVLQYNSDSFEAGTYKAIHSEADVSKWLTSALGLLKVSRARDNQNSRLDLHKSRKCATEISNRDK